MNNKLDSKKFQEFLNNLNKGFCETYSKEEILEFLLKENGCKKLTLENVRRDSMYKPKQFIQKGVRNFSEDVDMYVSEAALKTTPYTLLKTLHQNRDTQTNITFLIKDSIDGDHLSRNIKQWYDKGLFYPIKTRNIMDNISLLCALKKLPLINWESSKRYFMFNPQIIIPFIKNDREYSKYDFWCFVYKYIQYKEYIKKSGKLALHKKYIDLFINSMNTGELTRLTDNWDEFDKGFRKFIEKQEGDKHE